MARKQRYIPKKEPVMVRCARCGGTGFEPGTARAAAAAPFGTPAPTCRQCDGRGKVEVAAPNDSH